MHPGTPVRIGVDGAAVTEHQAAEYLGVSVRTLQAWRVRGGGPPYAKIGRSVRYRLSDLANFFAERIRTSTSDDALGAR